jgi:tRNA pseudouridine13 synthase
LRIKRIPEDFRVFELNSVRPAQKGPHGLYDLEKRGLSTFEALQRLARHLERPLKALSAAGLKDKHALTRQAITIAGKPVEPLRLKGLRLTPRGRAVAPATGADLRGNRFRIVLRDLDPGSAGLISERAARAAAGGLPNYFDEQRFGSLRPGEGFIARKLVDGDFEAALRLHLAAPSRLDSSRNRAQRKRLAQLWGNWQAAFEALPRSNDRSVVNYLRDHPQGFKRAFELIEPRLAQLYLFAYQSFLWNQLVAGYLRDRCAPDEVFEVRCGPGTLLFCEFPAPQRMGELIDSEIPLPHRKADFGDGDLHTAAAEALAAEGLRLDDLRLRGMKKLHFRAGKRRALVSPSALSCSPSEPDDIYGGRQKMTLEFELPPGAYATLLIKYLAQGRLAGRRSRRSAGSRRSSAQ